MILGLCSYKKKDSEKLQNTGSRRKIESRKKLLIQWTIPMKKIIIIFKIKKNIFIKTSKLRIY